MHNMVYLIFELNDELIAEHESESACAAYLADHVMMGMVDNREGFDWYSIEEILPFLNALEGVSESIENAVKDTGERISELRTFFEKHTDSELVDCDNWRFKFLCSCIGEYAGTNTPVYFADEYYSYDGISTTSELEFMIKDKKNLWVVTVDAHS
jgi:hypothetical protein